MTKAEAIERLENDCCKSRVYCELYPDACMKEECEVYMAIEALRERPKGKRIPCSERLPKAQFEGQRRGWYLTTNANGCVGETGYEFYHDFMKTGWQSDFRIVAWMPLPEAMKEGESNG